MVILRCSRISHGEKVFLDMVIHLVPLLLFTLSHQLSLRQRQLRLPRLPAPPPPQSPPGARPRLSRQAHRPDDAAGNTYMRIRTPETPGFLGRGRAMQAQCSKRGLCLSLVPQTPPPSLGAASTGCNTSDGH